MSNHHLDRDLSKHDNHLYRDLLLSAIKGKMNNKDLAEAALPVLLFFLANAHKDLSGLPTNNRISLLCYDNKWRLNEMCSDIRDMLSLAAPGGPLNKLAGDKEWPQLYRYKE